MDILDRHLVAWGWCANSRRKEAEEMLVVTAADHRMHEWMDRCRSAAEALGYRVLAIDLDQLKGQDFGLERDKDGFLPCYFKIPIIKLALNEDSEVLYLDSDCIMQDRVDEIWKKKFDVALTARIEPVVHEKAGKINTGVMAFRRTTKTSCFLKDWVTLAQLAGSEQAAANSLAGFTEDDQAIYGVARLPGKIYNNYYFDGSEKNAKIVHYKGDVRHHYATHLE